MADRVIIVGVSRGGESVPVSEIKQMLGRCGRKHEETHGTVEIIVEQSDEAEIMEAFESKDGLHVSSVMNHDNVMAFHVLPEIVSGAIQTKADGERWLARGLLSFQGIKADFDRVLEELLGYGAIEYVNGKCQATVLGEVSAQLYFHPGDVFAWQNNFAEIFNHGYEDRDGAIAWALGNVPFKRARGSFGKKWQVIDEYRNALPVGLHHDDGTTIVSVLWWYLLGVGVSVGPMRNMALSLKEDFGRIHRAMVTLDKKSTKWDKIEFFEQLAFRIQKMIPQELIAMCSLPGISKGRAMYLREIGITKAEDLQGASSQLRGTVDDEFADSLQLLEHDLFGG